MLRTVAIFSIFLLIGCREAPSKDDLHQLNGYWEIKEVEFNKGEKKEYTLGTSVDYIYLEGEKGYRKKMQPNIIGGFATSDDAVNFEIKDINGTLVFSYENNVNNWSERLVKLDPDSFAVINEEGVTYKYKRYKPINLTE